MLENGDLNYQSVLVRCWLLPSSMADEPQAWRFELRDVSAEAQQHRFSDLEQLKAFILAKLAVMADDRERDGDSEDSRKGEEP